MCSGFWNDCTDFPLGSPLVISWKQTFSITKIALGHAGSPVLSKVISSANFLLICRNRWVCLRPVLRFTMNTTSYCWSAWLVNGLEQIYRSIFLLPAIILILTALLWIVCCSGICQFFRFICLLVRMVLLYCIGVAFPKFLPNFSHHYSYIRCQYQLQSIIWVAHRSLMCLTNGFHKWQMRPLGGQPVSRTVTWKNRCPFLIFSVFLLGWWYLASYG